HDEDVFFSADPFFRGVELGEGPDGSVYVLDWSDTGECHENTGVVRSSGRIYRTVYEPNARKSASVDLSKAGLGELGKMAIHDEDVFFSADPFFRGVELGEGPDGSVYVLDWSDTGECHENTGVVRSSGRIYRTVYEPNARKSASVDLSKAGLGELGKMAIDGD